MIKTNNIAYNHLKKKLLPTIYIHTYTPRFLFSYYPYIYLYSSITIQCKYSQHLKTTKKKHTLKVIVKLFKTQNTYYVRHFM